MDNMDEDLISTTKSAYPGFAYYLKNIDFNRKIILFQSLVIILMLFIMIFVIPAFPYCRLQDQSSPVSQADRLHDEAHFKFNSSSSSSSYFDSGIENSCPILFKVSGHDDYSYGKFTISKPFNFFLNTYQFFYINSNGFVSFSYFDPSTVHAFPLKAVSIIAPFWSDIDLRFAGNIYHREVNDTSSVQQINADVKKRCPASNYKSEWSYVVTWNDAPVYLTLDERYGTKFQYRNIFQLLLTTDGVSSFAIFNYRRMDWPNEYVNSTFIAGYSSDETTFYVLANKTQKVLVEQTNVGTPGRWVLPLTNKPCSN